MDYKFILENILSNTQSGSDYKNFILVSKLWYSILNKLFPEGGHFVNHLTTLLKLFPDKNWNYSRLMNNPNITYNYMLSNPKFNRDSMISSMMVNPNIFDNLEMMKIVNNNLILYADILSYNVKLPFRMVIENPELDWIYSMISYNEVDIEFIKNNLDKNWDWTALSANKSITWDIVKNNSHLPWNYNSMFMNPNITWEIVLNNPSIFKNIKLFIINPNVYKSWDHIKKNIPIDYNILARDAPWDVIKEYPELVHNEYFKFNINMPSEMAIEHADDSYFEHAELSTEFIRSIINLKANRLSRCPTLTWRIVADNPDADWDFNLMSYNDFGKK